MVDYQENYKPKLDSIDQTTKDLLATEDLASKEPLLSQFDSQAQNNTLVGPGADAGIIRIPDSKKAIAITTDLKLKGKKDFIIEDFLDGVEFSHFSLVNHNHVIPLGMARDYKRVFDGGKGPNTGGMGAYSPVTDQDDYYSQLIVDQVVKPVAKEMVGRGTPFTGILFTGLMKVNQDFMS